jgi:NADH:ubiquinone reductase (H+-translocating)
MEAVDPRSLVNEHPRRVVVVGGGYAGLTFVVTLAHRMKATDGLEVVLVDPRPYQQALSELDLVAAGTPRPQFAELWYADVLRGLPIKIVHDRIENVCRDERCIETGPRGGPCVRIPYWRLVLATGATPFVPPVPGLREHALTVWSVDDALVLQRALEEQFRRAVTVFDAAGRAAALSVTVVGGGATGVEIVGTIAARLPHMIARTGHDPAELTVTLVEGRPDILYDLPETQRTRARRRLESMGVKVVLGRKLERVEDGTAVLEGGLEIPSAVLVWCGGAHADPDATAWGLVSDNSGRLVCDENLKASGHEDIYVVGDVAAFRDPASGRVLPMLAQFAIREAEHAADAVLRENRDMPARPFEPNMHGEFVSVGPGWGVGWMFHLNIAGWPAIVMKRITYIMYWVQVGSFRLAWKRTVQMLRMRR